MKDFDEFVKTITTEDIMDNICKEMDKNLPPEVANSHDVELYQSIMRSAMSATIEYLRIYYYWINHNKSLNGYPINEDKEGV